MLPVSLFNFLCIIHLLLLSFQFIFMTNIMKTSTTYCLSHIVWRRRLLEDVGTANPVCALAGTDRDAGWCSWVWARITAESCHALCSTRNWSRTLNVEVVLCAHRNQLNDHFFFCSLPPHRQTWDRANSKCSISQDGRIASNTSTSFAAAFSARALTYGLIYFTASLRVPCACSCACGVCVRARC